jgi:hydrogenase maturation protein HypF
VNYWLIHIEGQVQGVGFRPTAARIARSNRLNGKVYNTTKGVSIELYCTPIARDCFLDELRSNLSPLAIISTIHIIEIDSIDRIPDDFEIITSQTSNSISANISPDFGICRSCQAEVLDPKNRRYHYPFISCIDCGPRYAILEGIPYDRELSAMKTFEMCHSCQEEYQNVSDRRFHSQTNSCANCGIHLSLYPELRNSNYNQSELIELAVTMVKAGKIMAVKANAGFLLLADATNPSAIALLRERKKRPSKPLALMVPDLNSLSKYFITCEQERIWLESEARPIVLCQPRKTTNLSESADLIAPGLSFLGVCLPTDPLMFLIARKVGRPIISTSGNLHQSPLQSQNDQAIENLHGIADAILYHNRDIHFAQDDSVGRFAKSSKRKIILRRSKGLAPTFWNKPNVISEKCTLAIGADLKSSFALWKDKYVYVSQYLGNLESFDSQERYLQVLQRFLDLTGHQPEQILVDRHPGYHGRKLAAILPNTELDEVPHHEAHFAALLWEHALLECKEPILGVVWDGIGYGDDGAFWGAEFFVYNNKTFKRFAAFGYFDYLLADKMSREPRLAALSLCNHANLDSTFLMEKFSNQEWSFYSKLLQKTNHLQTNSMGRVFDAVASILGLADFNTYEGEAAMQVEQKAIEFIESNELVSVHPYHFDLGQKMEICFAPLIDQIVKDRFNGLDVGLITAKFHLTLVYIISKVILISKCKMIGFSGGVFQNALLVDMLHQNLGGDYQLFFHEQLSPNDENISLGQLAWYHIKNNYQSKTKFNYVFGDSR